jgi:hypothetical protein
VNNHPITHHVSRFTMQRATIIRLVAAAVFSVGTALIIWLALLDDPLTGSGQVDRSWVAGYLYDGRQFGQIVEPARRDLVGIRLWLPRPIAPGAGTITLRIQPIDSEVDLATAQLAVADLAANGPTTFWLPPVPMDRLTTTEPVPLRLLLTTSAVDRGSAVSVLAGPNGYSNGLLLRGQQGLPRADLAFEPLYQSRWLDRVLPITQMARSRPGILGWPPLYALLLWGVLWGYGWLLLNIVRYFAPTADR